MRGVDHRAAIDVAEERGAMYQRTLTAADVARTDLEIPGVSIRVLHTDEATGASAVLTRLEPGATIPEHHHTHADETVYVLDGDFVERGVSHGPGTFFAGKAGTRHGPHHSVNGCTVLTHFSAPLDFQM